MNQSHLRITKIAQSLSTSVSTPNSNKKLKENSYFSFIFSQNASLKNIFTLILFAPTSEIWHFDVYVSDHVNIKMSNADDTTKFLDLLTAQTWRQRCVARISVESDRACFNCYFHEYHSVQTGLVDFVLERNILFKWLYGFIAQSHLNFNK